MINEKIRKKTQEIKNEKAVFFIFVILTEGVRMDDQLILAGCIVAFFCPIFLEIR